MATVAAALDQSVTEQCNGNFTIVHTLALKGASLSGLPPNLFDKLTGLTYLSIEGQVSSLPESIFEQLGNLRVLDMEDNKLSSLPVSVFSALSRLQQLDISGNGLASLPAGVFDALTILDRLDLSGNLLSTLPANVFATLTALRNLELENNVLVSLDGLVFAQLGNLEELDMSGNQIAHLTGNVFNGLARLQKLDLSSNNLLGLPATIFDSLVMLLEIDLDSPPLCLQPALDALIPGSCRSVRNVANLRDTGFVVERTEALCDIVLSGVSSASFIDELETAICAVCQCDRSAVQTLRVQAGVDFTFIPVRAFVGFEANLEQISIEGSSGLVLDSQAFETTTNVRVLNLRANGITSLPPSLFDSLGLLQRLDLSSNQLTSLPADIFVRNRFLDFLDLHSNLLGTEAIPVSLVSAQVHMRTLQLSHNQLSTLPAGFLTQTTGLVALDLTMNGLVALQPEMFSELRLLVNLQLTDNAFESLPAGVFDPLVSLRVLALDTPPACEDPDLNSIVPGTCRTVQNHDGFRQIGYVIAPTQTAPPVVDLSNPWTAGILGAVVASSLFIVGGAIFYFYRKRQVTKMNAYSALMGSTQGETDGNYAPPMV
jgi:Leucine-rich repeat (LRR) protein